MKGTRLWLMAAVFHAAAIAAQPVRVELVLDTIIPEIERRAAAAALAQRFPELWSSLQKRLEHARSVLMPLRAHQLSGERAREASAAIDDVEKVRDAVAAILQTPASTPIAVPVLPTDQRPVLELRSATGEELHSLSEGLRKTRTDLVRTAATPTAELKQALAEGDRLLGLRPEQRASAVEVVHAYDRLLAAAKDPCEDDARIAYQASAAGNEERAYQFFSRLTTRHCFDVSLEEDARAFVQAADGRRMRRRPRNMELPPSQPKPGAGSSATPESQTLVLVPSPQRGDSTVRRPRFGLDVWRSAWGTFDDVSALVSYARRNSITSVNLNPGRGMEGSAIREAYAELKPIVHDLREAGVEEINYLYAELNYPIREYAAFLKACPELGIDTIVDDSEFTDDLRPRFEANLVMVKAAGLRYSAFITLESSGNSGVSDAVRYWALENIDQPILMSYFGCSVASQREVLGKYFRYADSVGRNGAVRVAILLGSKRVGRERSCEQDLPGPELQQFLRDLHGWAKQYPSYGGIVLETNVKLPRYEVMTRPFM